MRFKSPRCEVVMASGITCGKAGERSGWGVGRFSTPDGQSYCPGHKAQVLTGKAVFTTSTQTQEVLPMEGSYTPWSAIPKRGMTFLVRPAGVGSSPSAEEALEVVVDTALDLGEAVPTQALLIRADGKGRLYQRLGRASWTPLNPTRFNFQGLPKGVTII